MISTNDFKNGMTIEYDGQIFTILEFQHVKPGKGAAFVRSKLKNFKTGSITEKTFRAGEKVKKAHLERKQMQFLYNADEDYIFMDMEDFDQMTINKEQLGEGVKFIKENAVINVLFHEGENIGVELPTFVELTVSETEPGIKGDTVSGSTKSAKLETGATVHVPLFINEGDTIKVDTRTGEYIERV